MHIRVRDIFRRILNNWAPPVDSVLEIGATPTNYTLLTLERFKNTKLKIGIHLEKSCKYKDFTIKEGNSNNMKMFKNEEFDCVLCSSTFEHDKYFWKSLSEMKRVLKNGGLLVICVPGFVKTFLDKSPFCYRSRFLLNNITFTHCIHYTKDFGDYYRFSIQTVKKVFLEGLVKKEVYKVLFPPSIIGKGVKKV